MISKSFVFEIFFALILISGCELKKQTDLNGTLSLSIKKKIAVSEPSGIDLNNNETGFWVVSDRNSNIYLLDNQGKNIKSIKVNGNDIEGITVIDENRLAVVLEKTREVVILDTSGTELSRAKLEIEGELESGLEGITYDPEKKQFYLLNEKNPCLLLTLDKNLNELSRDTLKLSKDVSGIHFDSMNRNLWILSDEEQVIFQTNLTGNETFNTFKINVAQPEGITLNKTNTRLYIVSDWRESIYVFNLE